MPSGIWAAPRFILHLLGEYPMLNCLTGVLYIAVFISTLIGGLGSREQK